MKKVHSHHHEKAEKHMEKAAHHHEKAKHHMAKAKSASKAGYKEKPMKGKK